MRYWNFLIAAGLLGVVARCAPGAAATTYSFQYVAGQTAYSAPINSDVTISLYLREATSDGSQSSLIASEHGLLAAGVAVTFDSGSASAVIAGAAANNGPVPTGFDDANNSATFTATDAAITESTDSEPFGTDTIGVGRLAASPNVLLGTVTVHTGSLPGMLTTFNVATIDTTLGATYTNDQGYNLDNSTFPTNPVGAASLYSSATSSSFSITTSDTPEPAALAAIMLIPLLKRRRRIDHGQS